MSNQNISTSKENLGNSPVALITGGITGIGRN